MGGCCWGFYRGWREIGGGAVREVVGEGERDVDGSLIDRYKNDDISKRTLVSGRK